MSVMDKFEKMTSETAWGEWGWGVSLKPGSAVYRKAVGDTVIWVGLPHDLGPERWICEVEVGIELEGQWDGDTPYEAMLGGVCDSVASRSVREEWDEPAEQGLKRCVEDVVNAMAYYGFGVIVHGYERLDDLFPNTSEGRPTTGDELRLLDDLMGAAKEYLRFRRDCYGMREEDFDY